MPIFIDYYWSKGLPVEVLPLVIAGCVVGVVMIAYAALVLYDEPMRRWLRRKAGEGTQKSGALAGAPLG
jgi:peptidoglycan/LPS O-acetylase OafA/YrhL